MSDQDTLTILLRTRDGKRVKMEMKGVADSVTEVGEAGDKAGDKIDKRWKKTTATLKTTGKTLTKALTVPLAALAIGGAAAAVTYEDAFAGVVKTVDATPKQLERIDKQIRGMATTIPVDHTELAAIAEAAGQLGVKTPAIAGFTRTIADLGVSTNLMGEEGASTLARLANITKMPQSQFRRLGSTIVALGNAGASTEADIAAMGLRLAGAGAFVGMSEHQILAYANALSSMGIEAEAGGTAMSTVWKKLNSFATNGGKKLATVAKIAGVSGAEFKRAFEKDAAGATAVFIEGLGRLKEEGADVPGVLHELKFRDTRVQDTLLRAANNAGLLHDSLELGAKSWKKNNALTREAAKRYETTKSQLQILKNNVFDVGITVGSVLLPPLNKLAKWAGPKLRSIVDGFGRLPDPVKEVAAAGLVLMIVAGPLLLLLGSLGGATIGLVGAATAMAGILGVSAIAALGIAGAMALSTVGVLVFAAAFYIAYRRSEKFRESVNKLASWASTNWPTIATIFGGGLGALAGAFFRAGRAAHRLYTDVRSAIDKVVGAVNGIKGRIQAHGLFGGVKESFRAALNWVIGKWNGLEFSIGGTKILGKQVVPKSTLGTPDIPMLWRGGNVARPGAAVVGDRGPELLELPTGARVTPLDPPAARPAADRDDGALAAVLVRLAEVLDGFEAMPEGALLRKLERRIENEAARA
jgi:TP901 family phage tail tape measure protein